MNLIVSDNNVYYSGWTKISRLADLLHLVGEVDYLVFHKSTESEEDSVRMLSEFIRLHPECVILYVRNKSDILQAVRILIEGSKGKYIDDEFFLEDVTQLSLLLEEWQNIAALSEISSSSVLEDFLSRYSKGETLSKGYLTVVNNAVSAMKSDYVGMSLELLNICESAAELFKSSSGLITNIQEEYEKLEGIVEELKCKLRDVSFTPVAPQVGYFPRVSYMKSRVSIIRIKDLGRSSYLTSFIFGLRNYLQYIKRLRARLIVIEPLGEIAPRKYKNYSWVTNATKSDPNSYEGDVVFINYPLKDSMERLLSNPNYDIVIVLDRLMVSHLHLLNCAGSEVVYCVSGESYITEFKLNLKKCFSVVDIPGSLFKIPVFSDYPKVPDMRERKYLSECGVYYDMLYFVN
jgi:hypothetical protein